MTLQPAELGIGAGDSETGELADALKRAWRHRDFDAIDRLVERFATTREQMVLDWMPAMLAYHVPGWRPGKSLAFKDMDARDLVAQLDVAMFALVTPLAELYQTALTRRCTNGSNAMLVYEGLSRVPRRELADELAGAGDLKSQLQVISKWFVRCNQDAIDEFIWLCESSEKMKRLVAECAAYRFLTAAIVDRDSKVHLMPGDAPAALAEQLASGAISGVGIACRLADAFASVAGGHYLEITEDLVTRNLVDGRLLIGIARLELGDSRALTRVMAGCDTNCFVEDDETVMTSSPHRDYMNLFGTIDDFRRRHWSYMWFDPERFMMFGDLGNGALMGLADHLGSQIDPMTGEIVAERDTRHPKMGCPALAYKGVQALTQIVGPIFLDPIVSQQIAVASIQAKDRRTTSKRGASDLLAQFEVNHTTGFGMKPKNVPARIQVRLRK